MSDEDQGAVPAEKRVGPYWKGYEKGFADGKAQAAFGRETQFDAAKALVSQHWQEPDEALRTLLEELGTQMYDGHQLSRADTELVLGIARRNRSSASAEREAVRSLVRPRKAAGTPRVHRTDGDIVVS